MTSPNELADNELRSELIDLGFNAGPVTGTTRKLYEKKLEALRKGTATVVQKSKPTLVKKTPVKNNVEPSSPLVTTPLSAKRKGRKVQPVDTESSDNELELTVATDNGSSVTTRSSRSSTNKKPATEPLLIGEREHSPPRAISKRTPTPPRSSGNTSKRTPLRLNTDDSSFSVRGNIFSGDDYLPSSTKRFSNSYGATNSFDEDDHMETSRIISSNNRFEPFRSSIGSGGDYKNQARPFATKKESPIEKLRRFSKGAWGYFSRPINSSTPCADSTFGGKSLHGLYNSAGRHNRYSKYSPNKSTSSQHSLKANGESCDVSGWILVIVFSFLVILGLAYFFTANPKTIENGSKILQGAVRGTFNFFYTYAILPLSVTAFVLLVTFGGYQIHKYRETRKIEHKNKLMELVERITDVIRDTQNEGIAELHVRDILMPPTKRSSDDWKRWKEAADFINLEDSRVRTEVRLVDGDECNVWVWVPAAKQKWQGTAITERSLAHNVPSKALTRCIKLRGIAFTDRPGSEQETSELQNELLRKLSPIVPVHMEFVVAPENIVYMMLKDLHDAKNAFVAFHSHWFKGSLISAKYVRDERYMERFSYVRSLY